MQRVNSDPVDSTSLVQPTTNPASLIRPIPIIEEEEKLRSIVEEQLKDPEECRELHIEKMQLNQAEISCIYQKLQEKSASAQPYQLYGLTLDTIQEEQVRTDEDAAAFKNALIILLQSQEKIVELALPNNKFTDQDMQEILAVLENNCAHLRKLDLSGNILGSNALAGLMTVCARAPWLQTLNLRHCFSRLTEEEVRREEAVHRLCTALRSHEALRSLDINGNTISEHDFGAIASLAERNECITEIKYNAPEMLAGPKQKVQEDLKARELKRAMQQEKLFIPETVFAEALSAMQQANWDWFDVLIGPKYSTQDWQIHRAIDRSYFHKNLCYFSSQEKIAKALKKAIKQEDVRMLLHHPTKELFLEKMKMEINAARQECYQAIENSTFDNYVIDDKFVAQPTEIQKQQVINDYKNELVDPLCKEVCDKLAGMKFTISEAQIMAKTIILTSGEEIKKNRHLAEQTQQANKKYVDSIKEIRKAWNRLRFSPQGLPSSYRCEMEFIEEQFLQRNLDLTMKGEDNNDKQKTPLKKSLLWFAYTKNMRPALARLLKQGASVFDKADKNSVFKLALKGIKPGRDNARNFIVIDHVRGKLDKIVNGQDLLHINLRYATWGLTQVKEELDKYMCYLQELQKTTSFIERVIEKLLFTNVNDRTEDLEKYFEIIADRDKFFNLEEALTEMIKVEEAAKRGFGLGLLHGSVQKARIALEKISQCTAHKRELTFRDRYDVYGKTREAQKEIIELRDKLARYKQYKKKAKVFKKERNDNAEIIKSMTINMADMQKQNQENQGEIGRLQQNHEIQIQEDRQQFEALHQTNQQLGGTIQQLEGTIQQQGGTIQQLEGSVQQQTQVNQQLEGTIQQLEDAVWQLKEDARKQKEIDQQKEQMLKISEQKMDDMQKILAQLLMEKQSKQEQNEQQNRPSPQL
jgi:hypothetical protein